MESKCVNNLRVLSLYEIEKAKSGHSGIALSCAPILYSLYANVMNYSPKDDKNIFRDRFVMSAGHGSSALYATLCMFGFDISVEDLKNFRQLGSITSGHPEFNKTSGIDCSTGPLGEGIGCAVGMAIASKYFCNQFNKNDIKLFDNTIFCLVGDGCLMEGLSYEATSLAGTLNLDNLVLIYDYNKRTIDGELEIASVENIKKRFEAINFDVFEVQDGNSVDEITKNLFLAKKSDKPSIVVVNTVLGYASEFENQSVAHGKVFSMQEIEFVKQKLNINVAPFEMLEDVKSYVQTCKEKTQTRFLNQMQLVDDYRKKYPTDYARLLSYLNFEQNDKAVQDIKNFRSDSCDFRDINQEIFSAFRVENLIGGCADVEFSTKMFNKFDEFLSATNYGGKRINYGVREHAMGAISNGICLFGGMMSYASCFLAFSDFLKPSLRMSCFMNLPVLYVFTHDSFLIGQDGPSHQPVEQLVSLRSTPNLLVFRPYNDTEIKSAYIHFLKSKQPCCLVLNKLKYIFEHTDIDNALKGGYVLKKYDGKQKITLVASGYDVSLALDVAKKLQKENIGAKVVSMPCCELFDAQDEKYIKSVLNKNSKIFAIESGSSLGLQKYIQKGFSFGLDNFGEGGTPEQLAKKFGFTSENIKEKILKFLKK